VHLLLLALDQRQGLPGRHRGVLIAGLGVVAGHVPTSVVNVILKETN